MQQVDIVVEIKLKINNQRYDLRGVSASKEDAHDATKNSDKDCSRKHFCKIVPHLGNDPEYCNIMHATVPEPNRRSRMSIGEKPIFGLERNRLGC